MSEQDNEQNKQGGIKIDGERIAHAVFGAEKNSASSLDKAQLGKYSRIASQMFHTPVLTVKEMIFPALAHFGARLVTGLGMYRTLYFVSVLKIDMVYVTAILTLIGIWDVLNDPLMGIVYDKTRTRWGKARPYMLLTPIPYFVSTAVLYSGALFFGENDTTDDPRKILFVFVTLFIQETFFTIYNMPKENFVTLMTPNPSDRINVGIIQSYAFTYAGDLVATLYLPLQDLSRLGVINISQAGIFAMFGVVTCVLGIVGNMTMAVGCRERIMLQPKPAPITKTMFYVLKNKYAMRNFIASFASSWWSGGGYSWDVVTQMEIFGGAFKTIPFYIPWHIFNAASLVLLPKFKRMFHGSYRKTYIMLRIWDFCGSLGQGLIGSRFVETWWKAGLVFAFFYGTNALNNAPADVFNKEIGREINDYTEYVTGERPDGTIGLLQNLIMKVTSPLNALMTIAIFKWSGYDATISMAPWSQNNKYVYQKVMILYALGSSLPHIISTIPYFFYDLEGEKKEKMYVELNERRAMLAKEDKISDEMEALMEMISEEEKPQETEI